MTTAEQEAYQAALMNSATIVEELADYHGEYTNFAPLHTSGPYTQFLPWHRLFLWEMEDALRRNGSFPGLTIPYWDWVEEGTSKTDALFTTFLPEIGPGEDEWPWRSFSRCFDECDLPGTLPISDDIADLQSLEIFWEGSVRDYVYLSLTRHQGGHQFVGGDLFTDYSPIDPLFYLHHAMVDKLWQAWEEREGTSYTTGGLPHAMLRYDGSTYSSTFGTLPEADNHYVVDGRDSGVFYSDAELSLVKLNGDYRVKNTPGYTSYDVERFLYPGTIEASYFTVPSGKSALINSSTRIVLKAGFISQGNLVLRVGGYDDNFPTSFAKRAPKEKVPASSTAPDGILAVQRLPGGLDVSFQVAEAASVTAEAYDPKGRKLNPLTVLNPSSGGRHTIQVPLQNGYTGILYLRLRVGNKYYRKVVNAL
jgi:hypothetical protein